MKRPKDMHAPDELLRLAKDLAQSAPETIDCDETLLRLATYLEQASQDAALEPYLEAVRLHLAKCPPCQEEFDALVLAVKPSPSS